MTVEQLMAILATVDPNLEIATHAHNHTCHHPYQMRVVLLHTYAGPCLAIGDFGRKHVNYPNEYVTQEVDGGPEIPENYRQQ
jgi:hypothetical protein